jgi:prevent-host-death family protein
VEADQATRLRKIIPRGCIWVACLNVSFVRSCTRHALVIDRSCRCSHNDYMAPNLVGARELKARLGTYLRRVREGRTLIVTDRGDPIAELRPLGAATGVDAVLAKLQAAGAVTRTTNAPLRPFRQVNSRGRSAAAAVLEDRQDRF